MHKPASCILQNNTRRSAPLFKDLLYISYEYAMKTRKQKIKVNKKPLGEGLTRFASYVWARNTHYSLLSRDPSGRQVGFVSVLRSCCSVSFRWSKMLHFPCLLMLRVWSRKQKKKERCARNAQSWSLFRTATELRASLSCSD